MNRFLLPFVFLAALVEATAHASPKQIAFTFDDAPRYGTTYFSGPKRAKHLIAELKNSRVPPVFFFCNTERFDEEGVKRIKSYASAGHLIANHSHSHKDLHVAGASEFVQDIGARTLTEACHAFT